MRRFWTLPRMSRAVPAAILAVLTGALAAALSLAPFWLAIEDHLGLVVLFSLRGSQPAPDQVAIVAIDKASADALDLPADPARWPRSLHARLTDTLSRAGAKVIVFDMFFEQPRGDDEDARFASSIAEARTVVLSKFVARDLVPLGEGGGRGGWLEMERLVSPLPMFGSAAVAAAPFPLPKLPLRLNQYWTFKSGAGSIPTLPVVALQVFAADAYGDLARLLARLRPDRVAGLPADGQALLTARRVDEVVFALRDVFEADPALATALLDDARTEPSLSPERRQLLRALIGMYAGPDSEYLNFYGPPQTVRTISYHRVVSPEASAEPGRLGLEGKAVFVGLSDHGPSGAKDGFHTVFSRQGVDISGVEVAATAFANTLGDRHLKPLPFLGHLAVVFAGGALIGAICALLAPVRAAACALGLGGAYLALAAYRFSIADEWYPLTALLLFAVPAAFFGAILWRYGESNRQREEMRKVFAYYLPAPVIDDLLHNASPMGTSGRMVYGICLATDAERYTSLAESMDPEELARFVNRYYAIVFEPIRRHGGTISDVVGDSALAIWTAAGPDSALRSRACHAACDVAAAVDRFNRASTGPHLPTRIGLHSGRLVIGNVGAGDHYEYRAVGDIVNTANRIQGLNKRFHSRILASEDVIAGLPDFLTRPLGTFFLAGKSKPLLIHELICRETEASDRQRQMAQIFCEGTAAYAERRWATASEAFHACLSESADDEAARFYLTACAEYQAHPPGDSWEPAFHVDAK